LEVEWYRYLGQTAAITVCVVATVQANKRFLKDVTDKVL
jgi:hypothetical protein